MGQALLVAGGGVAQLVHPQHDVHVLVLLQRQGLRHAALLPVHVEGAVVLAVRLEHGHAPGPVEIAVLHAAVELKALGAGVAQEHGGVKKAVVLHRRALLQRDAEFVGLHQLGRGLRRGGGGGRGRGLRSGDDLAGWGRRGRGGRGYVVALGRPAPRQQSQRQGAERDKQLPNGHVNSISFIFNFQAMVAHKL